MAAEEIPVSAYASRLWNRVEVSEGTIAFHFEKPTGFDFKPGQSADLTLPNPQKPTPKEMSAPFPLQALHSKTS
jgi:NAD(P)H-flavin reductase